MPRPELGPRRPPPVAALAALIERAAPRRSEAQALTHSSWTEERVDSFERLAFVGDSVLGLAVASSLFERFPELDSGGLTKVHNQAVSGVSCFVGWRGARRARDAARGRARRRRRRRFPPRSCWAGERPLPEATEALIGACFLSFGFERTAAAVAEAFELRIAHAAETRIDFKSALQELLARRGARVSYEVIAAIGPPHQRTFEVAASVDSDRLGLGEGRSKKAAEQAAAEQALKRLGG